MRSSNGLVLREVRIACLHSGTRETNAKEASVTAESHRTDEECPQTKEARVSEYFGHFTREAIRRGHAAASQQHADELAPLPDVVFDLLMGFHPGSDVGVILRPDIASLVLTLGSREIKIPIIAALDRNGNKPTFKGKICLKLSIERPLREFSERRSVNEVNLFHRPIPL